VERKQKNSLRQILGAVVVIFILVFVGTASFYEPVTISDSRIRLLILLAGGLLGLDGAKKMVVESKRPSGDEKDDK